MQNLKLEITPYIVLGIKRAIWGKIIIIKIPTRAAIKKGMAPRKITPTDIPVTPESWYVSSPTGGVINPISIE